MKNIKKPFKREYRFLAAALAAIIVVVFTGTFAYASDNIIDDIKQILKIYYVDELPKSVYEKTSVADILKEVNKNDPYTKYYTSSKYNELVNSINNDTSGIGIYIEMSPDGAKIVSVKSDTAEKNAGLMVGDTILMADNHLLVGLSQDSAIRYIKGEEGKTVVLKIKRGTELIPISIYREEAPSSTITGQVLDKHIGYIKISTFSEDGDELFTDIISQYEKMKLDSYIIDLRYNVGGYVKAATDIAGYFVGNNVVLRTKGRLAGEKTYYGKFHGKVINKPVIFVVNKYSASASEILAGAIKDYKRAYIIGTKTFGKGVIQWPARLANNDVLRLTIERFYSPKGTTIAGIGVSPDLSVEDDTVSMNIAELLLDSKYGLPNYNGFIKVNFNSKSIIMTLSKAQNPKYWQTYKYLLKLAQRNGSVMLGSGTGWTTVSKKYLDSVAKMYYPNYKEIDKASNVKIENMIVLHFEKSINKSSYNDKNIELVDAQTGDRVPVNFLDKYDNSVTLCPKNYLKFDKTYYIVEHPSIKTKDNKSIGNGRIIEIKTIKNLSYTNKSNVKI